MIQNSKKLEAGSLIFPDSTLREEENYSFLQE